MSLSGSNDLKDHTIHGLVQLLQAKETEIKNLRAQYEELKLKLGEAEKREMSAKDESVQTDTQESTDNTYPELIGSVNSLTDTEQTYDSKNFQDEVTYSGQFEAFSLSDNSEKINPSLALSVNNSPKQGDSRSEDIALEQINVMVDESIRPRQLHDVRKHRRKTTARISRYQPRRFTLKRGPKDETTQKCFMRYQMATKRISLRKKGGIQRTVGEKDQEAEDASDLKTVSDGRNSKDQREMHASDESNATMKLLILNHDYDTESEISYSSSNNDYEINCHEINRHISSSRTQRQYNPDGSEEETERENGVTDNGELRCEPTSAKLHFGVPYHNLCSEYLSLSDCTQESQCNNGSFSQHQERYSPSEQIFRKYLFTDTDDSLNESYV